ncbi:MAG: methionyl-tRNA formyltransferase, partial [Candidatus Latescibacteria bacterium]|nr:methionyl-tRNA formyltransferase [Candidatus Latescibacterota bacterium]
MMRIVFMGTADFGIPTLRILGENHEIALVVTRPDRPRGRGRAMLPTPVKSAAIELGVPVLDPDRLYDPSLL